MTHLLILISYYECSAPNTPHVHTPATDRSTICRWHPHNRQGIQWRRHVAKTHSPKFCNGYGPHDKLHKNYFRTYACLPFCGGLHCYHLAMHNLNLSTSLPRPPPGTDPSTPKCLSTHYRTMPKILVRLASKNSVQGWPDSIATILVYFMSVFLIPKSVLKTLDSIRRAFFWAAEETCTGAQCLVAWKNVCKPKRLGGLGLKNLHVQNNCLLMKFAVKALLPDQTPWQDWIDLQHPNALIAPQNSHSFLCQTINHQLPALHSISFVITQSGTNTYFWLDIWLH